MVYIFGHRKPDTDSVTSAIALSYLKNQIGVKSEPRVLGKINDETKFVLDYFNVDVPKILDDVKLQLKNVNYFKGCYVNAEDSLFKAYNYMLKYNVTGMPVVTQDKKLIGLLTSKIIVNEMIKGSFDKIDTLYDNIVEILEGESLLKFDEKIKGIIDNDIVIVDTIEKFKIAKIKNPKLIVIVKGIKVTKENYKYAKDNKINIIKTNFTTFKVDKLITLSNCCIILKEKLRKKYFYENSYYDDFREEASKLGYNNFPILNSNGKCLGLIRITDSNKPNRNKVILVDHNEAKQSVYGLEEAEILEIIDHHKISTVSTNMPINFRNMTVGSTNTIVYSLFAESGVAIPKNIAGLMLSGLISDTLMFTSPTTTDYDKFVGKQLAQIAQINIEKYAKEMFKAGTNLNGKTILEIIDSDTKTYDINRKKVYTSQVLTLNSEEIISKEKEYIEALNNIKSDRDLTYVILLITDMIKGGSYIYFSDNAKSIVATLCNKDNVKQGIFLNKILSRKKQILPMLMDSIR